MRIGISILSALAVALTVMAGGSRTGCADPSVDAAPGTLLFDYYEGQAGLPMEPGYDEITLTATQDPDKVQLDVYSRPTGDGEIERRTTYIVSAQALQDVMELVREHDMPGWGLRPGYSMAGKIYVCKFWWEGEFLRITSEHMPEDGTAAFDEICCALYGCIDPGLEIESPGEGD